MVLIKFPNLAPISGPVKNQTVPFMTPAIWTVIANGFAKASPNPVSDERKLKNKDKTKLAKRKNLSPFFRKLL